MIKITKTPPCYLTTYQSKESCAPSNSPPLLPPLKTLPWKPSGSLSLLIVSRSFTLLVTLKIKAILSFITNWCQWVSFSLLKVRRPKFISVTCILCFWYKAYTGHNSMRKSPYSSPFHLEHITRWQNCELSTNYKLNLVKKTQYSSEHEHLHYSFLWTLDAWPHFLIYPKKLAIVISFSVPLTCKSSLKLLPVVYNPRISFSRTWEPSLYNVITGKK